MKKFLSIFAIMVMAVMGFSSCSNDIEPIDSIVGQWKQTWNNGRPGEDGSYILLEIKADHTFVLSDYDPDGTLDETIAGTWKYDGKWKTPVNMVYGEYPKVLFTANSGYNEKGWGVFISDVAMYWLDEDGDLDTYPFIKQ